MENPTSAPMAELKEHKLCISDAREGWIMLFCATQASIVTSAIAIPALEAVKAETANTRCNFSCNDNKSMELTPRQPEN